MRRIEIPGIVLAAIALFSLYAWAVYASTFWHPGSIGVNFDGPGTDYMVFYGAVRLFSAGKHALIYEGQHFTDYLNSVFAGWMTSPLTFRPWVYPPSYLMLMLPFGKLGFFASYLVFQLATASLLVIALLRGNAGGDNRVWVTALALICPAAAWNAALGQNAFLVSALLAGGFLWRRHHPLLGGAVLGLLSFKPQFWFLIPVALVAARDWRALAASLLSAVALAAASAAVLGVDIWRRWIDLALTSYADPHAMWVEHGRMWGDSVYACLVTSGLPGSAANIVQLIAMAVAAAAVYRGFRGGLTGDSSLAVLLAATILAAPHSTPQDSVMLTIAAALWVFGEAEQARAAMWKWTLALALCLAPLFNPPLISPAGRLTPILILTLIGAILAAPARRALPRPAVSVRLGTAD